MSSSFLATAASTRACASAPSPQRCTRAAAGLRWPCRTQRSTTWDGRLESGGSCAAQSTARCTLPRCTRRGSQVSGEQALLACRRGHCRSRSTADAASPPPASAAASSRASCSSSPFPSRAASSSRRSNAPAICGVVCAGVQGMAGVRRGKIRGRRQRGGKGPRRKPGHGGAFGRPTCRNDAPTCTRVAVWRSRHDRTKP